MNWERQRTPDSLGGLEFNDLLDNSEVGLIRRGITRYLFSRNAERTVRTHRMLGASITRKVVMGSFGRFWPRCSFSNYRTDATKTRIESSTRFAVGGSVFNEVIHTAAGLQQSYEMAQNMSEGRSFGMSAVAVAVNAALVSLQRYNRARMTQKVDEELAEGKIYNSGYENWLGIDSRAVDNCMGEMRRHDHIDIEELAINSSTPLQGPTTA